MLPCVERDILFENEYVMNTVIIEEKVCIPASVMDLESFIHLRTQIWKMLRDQRGAGSVVQLRRTGNE